MLHKIASDSTTTFRIFINFQEHIQSLPVSEPKPRSPRLLPRMISSNSWTVSRIRCPLRSANPTKLASTADPSSNSNPSLSSLISSVIEAFDSNKQLLFSLPSLSPLQTYARFNRSAHSPLTFGSRGFCLTRQRDARLSAHFSIFDSFIPV